MHNPPETPQALHLLYEPAGFICAFRFEDSRARQMKWNEVIDHRPAGPEFTWLHVKTADVKIRQWMEHHSGVPEHITEFLLSSDTHPGLHMTADSVYGTLTDMKMEIGDTGTEKGALHFYLDRTRLLTLRTQPLCSTNLLRQKVLDGAGFDNTMDLFAELLRCLADGFNARLDSLNDKVDDIEFSVLSDRRSEDRAELGSIRRQLAELRRFIAPERRILSQFNRLRPSWVAPEALEDLTHALDELNELHSTVEAVYERAKLLQEEIASQMSEQMNRNLMALSILTALLMPATLVSGIFGMNVAGLPGLHDEASFWMVMAVMLGLGVATVAFLKWLKIW
ncbi:MULTISPECIES: transporter [unclassified Herbaspirillum]|uniref:transporter n=1 Tax=unclassified Herbaspirillum TaxID=2624150 RepID=UPI001152E9B5|nr:MULTISPECIES: transporter [unclassified Herbaspirillum]MBB5391465.1 zinc transporter [Herbaspirillum sp. SJZ102]TQK12850.1 zinc transporter [Herbaspirillum sp. SJZ130]TQK14854.1 zinc transporter [Herbaspirillum sp. SJZ106]TWC67209.1 zinc transporter [Herbaspirillum sp. SJZ099]